MMVNDNEVYGVIYKITNNINNKVYIGQTMKPRGFLDRYPNKGVGIERVYKFHKNNKNRGDGYNEPLFNAIEKYGFDAFSVDEIFDTAMSEKELNENAKNSKSSVSCESLMLDDISISDTIPTNDIRTDEVEFSHEAKIGKISDKTIFYLMSRGLSEEDAKAMIVRGFAHPIAKELPVEYAVEMNNLINLELEGAIG